MNFVPSMQSVNVKKHWQKYWWYLVYETFFASGCECDTYCGEPWGKCSDYTWTKKASISLRGHTVYSDHFLSQAPHCSIHVLCTRPWSSLTGSVGTSLLGYVQNISFLMLGPYLATKILSRNNERFAIKHFHSVTLVRLSFWSVNQVPCEFR